MSQDKHFLEIITPLDNSDLQLRSLHGHEEISNLFSFDVEFEFRKGEISQGELIQKLVGKNVSLRIELADRSPRYFNGFVRRLLADYGESMGTVYRMELVPFFWFLTQTADCRIFQEMSIPDIVQQIMGDNGYGDWLDTSGLKAQYKTRGYCVQYRESDYQFVSRLLEEEGIFYYFVHENGKHKMVLGDSVDAYYKLPQGDVPFPRVQSPSGAFRDHLTDWDTTIEFRPGKWAQTDYNFETPSTSLMTNESTTLKLPDAKKYEVYDYPGGYAEKPDGIECTKRRMEMEEAQFQKIEVKSTCRTFSPGGKFKIVDEHPSPEELGKSYVVTSVTHSSVDPSKHGSAAEAEYVNQFTCIPEAVVYRPPQRTPRPEISGIQTAVVVGPKGEEIYTDKYGRIKVQFHWDREGTKDENSSCWIRVAHTMAGNKWGFMAIPRIGQEVVVVFLEGDPDQPLVVGSVYNDEQMPYYDPQSDAQKISIKSNSTKGGKGFNEITLDDKANSERVYVHAQKNMDVFVENHRSTTVGGDEHRTVGTKKKDGSVSGGNETILIRKDRWDEVQGNELHHTHGNHALLVGAGENPNGGNLAVAIEKSVALQIGAAGLAITVDGDQAASVGASATESVAQDKLTVVGANQHTSVGGEIAQECQNYSVDASMEHHSHAGMAMAMESGMEMHLKAGMNLVLEAGMSLTLKVGGNFISINPAGVQIQGTMVTLNTGGMAGVGVGCKPKSCKKPQQRPKKPQIEKSPGPKETHKEKTGYKSARD